MDLTDRLERIEVDLGVDDLNADDRAALESIQSDVSALLDADCEDARSDCDATSGETTVAESGLLSGGLSGSVLGMGAAILGVLVVGLVLAAVLRREDNDGYDIMPVAMQGSCQAPSLRTIQLPTRCTVAQGTSSQLPSPTMGHRCQRRASHRGGRWNNGNTTVTPTSHSRPTQQAQARTKRLKGTGTSPHR